MKQIAIITGASSGIGEATATKFIGEGWSLINLSRRRCPVAGVQNILVDLSNTDAVEQACLTISAQLESFPSKQCCLIHNASLMLKNQGFSTNDEDMQRSLSVNILAVNALNRCAIPLMTDKSSILFVGSTLSEKAVGGAFTYIISKHAQLGMMRALCQDLAGTGVHTAMICPGFTDTEMLRKHLNHDTDLLQSISSMNAFGRLISPGEIADLICFARDNPVINGAVLHGHLGQLER